jgi:hypothetical protein
VLFLTKKKGTLVLKKGNQLKVSYAQRDAQLDGLGKKIVKMIRLLGIEGLNKAYDNIILVDEEDPMTLEQIQAYKKYMPEQLWKEDLDWTTALKYTKDITKPIIDGFPYVVDYSSFCGSWRNRFRYIVDLDNNMFIVVKGGLEMLSQQSEEFFADADYVDKVAYTIIGRFPLDNIPDDWAETCKKYWSSLMLVAVDYSKNKVAMYSEKIQQEAKPENDRDYEKIKFFYGENGYNDLFNDMD